MAYGLNVEMLKQTEIVKRLTALCLQLVPYLSQEVKTWTFHIYIEFRKHIIILFFLKIIIKHQQQVTAAIERAKQVSLPELNSIV